MKRPALLAAAAALIAVAALTGTTPANAAPSQPSSPSRVAVTGKADAATVTWAAGAAVRGVPVTGYTVAVTPAEKQPNHGVDKFGPRTFSDRFGNLTPGTTYTFTVRATSARTTSAPVTVKYTRPGAHVESLYAVNAAGALLRRPVAGGAWTTVTTAGHGYTVDASGTAYVPSVDGTTITASTETGGSRVVATGLSILGPLYADDAGDVFFTQSGSVVKVPHGSSTVQTVGSGSVRAVSPNGIVAAQTLSLNVAVYGPSGTTRTIPGASYNIPGPIGVDNAGDVYLRIASTGASGYYTIGVAEGSSTTPTSLLTPSVSTAITHDGALTALQSTTWCNTPARNSGSCIQDNTVSSLFKRAASGTVTNTPISGLDMGFNAPAAADAAGNVFLSPTSGPNTGLVRVPAAGGAVQQLESTSYRELSVH